MKRILLAITLLLNINLIAQCDTTLSVEYDTLRSHHNVEFTIDRSWISGVRTYLETGTGDTVVNMVHNLLTGKTKGNFTYDSMGSYEAVLTLVDNATQQVSCRDTQLVKIECDAKFDYSFDSTNTIDFVNQSNPIDSLAFEWRPLIRSSAIVDTTRDLQYTYQQPSVYYPNLMATLPNGKKCGISDTISVNFCPLRWDVSRDSVFFKIHSMSTYFDSVIWKFGDGSVSSSFTRDWLNSSILHTKTKHHYLIDSSYEASVSVIDEFGNTCRDTIIVHYKECHAAFTKSLDTLNNKVILANYSSSSVGTQYRYSFGDGTPNVVSTSKNMSHTYSQYGTYEVCVTVSNFTNGQRCNDTYCDSVGLDSLGNLKSTGFTVEFVDSNFVTSVEGLANTYTRLEGVVVYPNPSKNIFNIDLSLIDAQSEVLEMELYSTYGSLILKRRLNSPMEKVDLSNYADGLYFLRLSLGDKVSVEKLIKN